MDIYEAIVGEPPTSEEKLRALASQLRRRQMLGQLGQLTGDKVLSPLGQNIGGQVEEQAGRIGGYSARRRELEGQEAMRAASDASRAREGMLGRSHTEGLARARQEWEAEQNRLDRENRLAEARLRASKADIRNFSDKQIDELSTEIDEADRMMGIVEAFKPEYARVGFPGGREVLSVLAQKGIGSSADKEAQNWWASWDRAYTLPERNKLFGAALTKPEIEAWKKAAIDPSMTPEQIQEKLAEIAGFRFNAITRMRQRFADLGYDPDDIDALFGPMGTDNFPPEGVMSFDEWKASKEAGQL